MNAAPSVVAFRASLLGLLVGSVLALWLLVRPPGLPGESSEAQIPPLAEESSPGATPTAVAAGAAAEPSPTAVPAPEPTPEGPLTYTVVEGDTLYGIADAFGISAEDLAAANGIDINDPLINIGDELIIPQ